MLDDVQLAYFDSSMTTLNYKQHKSENECIDQKNFHFIFGVIYKSIKDIALFSKYQLNLTHGKCMMEFLLLWNRSV